MPKDIKQDLIAAIMEHMPAHGRERFINDFGYEAHKVDEEDPWTWVWNKTIFSIRRRPVTPYEDASTFEVGARGKTPLQTCCRSGPHRSSRRRTRRARIMIGPSNARARRVAVSTLSLDSGWTCSSWIATPFRLSQVSWMDWMIFQARAGDTPPPATARAAASRSRPLRSA
jgi:hypothetical protein